jgi:hypothetical protein
MIAVSSTLIVKATSLLTARNRLKIAVKLTMILTLVYKRKEIGIIERNIPKRYGPIWLSTVWTIQKSFMNTLADDASTNVIIISKLVL